MQSTLTPQHLAAINTFFDSELAKGEQVRAIFAVGVVATGLSQVFNQCAHAMLNGEIKKACILLDGLNAMDERALEIAGLNELKGFVNQQLQKVLFEAME